MAGAIRAIKDFNLGPNHRVVVLLADSVRNYMSKFLSDEWMVGKYCMETLIVYPFFLNHIWI